VGTQNKILDTKIEAIRDKLMEFLGEGLRRSIDDIKNDKLSSATVINQRLSHLVIHFTHI
jgi:hypothetical protein